VHVRRIDIGMMATYVPDQCESSAFTRGVLLNDKVVGILKKLNSLQHIPGETGCCLLALPTMLYKKLISKGRP
jgi:hypothetical protein